MTTKLDYVLIAPDGALVTHIFMRAIESAPIDGVDADGSVAPGAFEDFPTMDTIDASDGDGCHVRTTDSEFLSRHCRVVRVYQRFPEDDLEDQKIAPWPEEIVSACSRADYLSYALVRVADLRRALPQSYKDTTTTAALDTLVEGRLKDELAQLEERIAKFRKWRVEPVAITEDLELVYAT